MRIKKEHNKSQEKKDFVDTSINSLDIKNYNIFAPLNKISILGGAN